MKRSRDELEQLIKEAANNDKVRASVKSGELENLFTFRLAGVNRENPLSSLESIPDFKIFYYRLQRVHFSGSFTKFYVAKLADNVIGTAEMEAEGFRGTQNDAHGLFSMHILEPGQDMDAFAKKLIQDNMKAMLKTILPEFRDIVRDYAEVLGEDDIKTVVKEQIDGSVFEKIFEEHAPSPMAM